MLSPMDVCAVRTGVFGYITTKIRSVSKKLREARLKGKDKRKVYERGILTPTAWLILIETIPVQTLITTNTHTAREFYTARNPPIIHNQHQFHSLTLFPKDVHQSHLGGKKNLPTSQSFDSIETPVAHSSYSLTAGMQRPFRSYLVVRKLLGEKGLVQNPKSTIEGSGLLKVNWGLHFCSVALVRAGWNPSATRSALRRRREESMI